MKGKVTEIVAGSDGRKLARVELEGVEGSIQIAYWPELLKQWGPDRLRGWLVAQAEASLIDTEAAAAAHAEHEALVGEAEGDPGPAAPEPAACNLGAVGCVLEHDPAEAEAVGHSAEPRSKIAT